MKIIISLMLLSFLPFYAWAQQPQLVTPLPHTSFVNTARFSHDGKFIVTASEDHTAKLWDAYTGQLLFTARHSDKVSDIAFSNNDQLLLTVSEDSTACIWDLSTRSLKHRLSGHAAPLVAGNFSPDGTKVITGARENIAILWDVASGKIIRQVTVFEYDAYIEGNGAVYAVSFDKSGERFLTGAFNGQCKLWNTQTGDTIRSFTASGSFIKVARFSSDEQYIVAAEWSGFDSYIWETNTGHLVQQVHSDSYFQEYACLASDNKLLLTAVDDTTAGLYQVSTGTLLHRFHHAKHIHDAILSDDNSRVITVSWDEKVKVWNAVTGALLHVFSQHDGMVLKAAFSPTQRFVVTASTDYTAKVWDIQNGNLHRDLNYPGYVKKEGSYFVPGEKIAIDNSNLATLFDMAQLKTATQLPFSYLRYELKNNREYLTNQPGGDTGALFVYDRSLQNVLTVKDIKFPYFFSSSGNYFFANTHGNTAYLFNMKTGKPVAEFTQAREHGIVPVAFSAGDKTLAFGTRNGMIYVYNIIEGKQQLEITGNNQFMDLLITKDDRFLLATSGNYLYYFSMTDGSLYKTVAIGESRLTDIRFTADERYVITLSEDKKARSYLLFSDAPAVVVDHKPFESGNAGIIFGQATNEMVSTSITSKNVLWHVTKGVLQYENARSVGNHFIFSTRASLAAFCDSRIKVWDLGTATLKREIIVSSDGYETVRDAGFSPDGSMIVAATYEKAALFDVATGAVLTNFPELTNRPNSCGFTPDGSKLLIGTDGFDYVYNTATLKLLYTIFTHRNKEYLVRTPDGYYTGSQNIVKQLHYVTDRFKTIGFQQLDVKYNRPDKVLQSTGSKDTLLVNSYRNAWQKRMKKLGIDTATFYQDDLDVPVADVVNRPAIVYEQRNHILHLPFSASDKKQTLSRFNIWVNEVPVYGSGGIDIAKKRSYHLDTTIAIALSEGENRIEFSVTNTVGIESYRTPLFVKYTPAKPRPARVHFIGIGVNRYAAKGYDLHWSVKDIRDLAIKLKQRYPQLVTDTLFDAAVTKQNILALKKKLLQLDVDDIVIVSYSGHGVLSTDLDYYLSTYAINFARPEKNGLSYDAFESLLDGIKPRRKLMLIDACHSGELDKEEIEKITKVATRLDSLGTSIDTANRSTIKVKKKLGMGNSFELMQSLFTNISRGTGATIISAAGGMQYAQERGDLKNGVFTYSIIEAFNNNNTLTVSQLKTLVGERVTQLTHGLQRPTSRNETSNYDWVVW